MVIVADFGSDTGEVDLQPTNCGDRIPGAALRSAPGYDGTRPLACMQDPDLHPFQIESTLVASGCRFPCLKLVPFGLGQTRREDAIGQVLAQVWLDRAHLVDRGDRPVAVSA